MIQLSEIANIRELKQTYDPAHVEKAIKFANIKTARKAKTLISKLVREDWNVKVKDINRHTTIKRNYDGNYDASILYTGKRLNLAIFGAKEVKNIGGRAVTTAMAKNGMASRRAKRATKKSGVTIKLRKNKGRELVRGFSKFGGKNGANKGFLIGNSIFARETSNRLPINRLRGPSISQMVGKKTLDKAFQFIKQEHHDQFSQHLEKLISGIIK